MLSRIVGLLVMSQPRMSITGLFFCKKNNYIHTNIFCQKHKLLQITLKKIFLCQLRNKREKGHIGMPTFVFQLT